MLFVYPDAKIKEEGGNLILFPGKTHIQKQAKSGLVLSAETKQAEPIKPKTDMQTDAELQKKYSEYRLDAVVDIVENLPDETERHKLLKDFENHLTRKGLHKIRSQIIKGQHTKPVKEELYHFVNSHWHHVLEFLKPYKEFCETLAK